MKNKVAVPALGVSALLDLKVIDEPQRAALWSKTAKSYFPGISVRELRASPIVGVMQGMPFGSGHLWIVLSPPLQASYDPPTYAAPPGTHAQAESLKVGQLADGTQPIAEPPKN